MRISISQPAYLPWLGYLERIYLSDLHVILDHVPDGKKSMVNRNKIRTREGWNWLTIPIKSKNRYSGIPIKDLEINNESDWKTNHWKSIQGSYAKSNFFHNYSKYIEQIYNQEYIFLKDINEKLTELLLKNFSINTPLIKSSSLNIKSTKSQLILDICKHFDTQIYISGPFGRDYLDMDKFNDAQIKIFFHDYKHPKYIQNFDGFESYMSSLDLLFNCGDESYNIFKTTSINNLK